jgi:phage terminase small subunit
MGRPPKPAELKRATGRTPNTDSGGRPIPKIGEVVPLPMANGIPDAPSGLEEAGMILWRRAWGHAITWLSPDSDFQAIENACRLADVLSVADKKYRATLEAADGRLVVALHKQMADALSSLGFDPVSRSRLGVAEVKRVSALDELINKKQNRQR